MSEIITEQGVYFTYILRCVDNSLYTGIASNIERRMSEHFTGSIKCAKYTKTHRPKKLEAVWRSKDRSSASKLEFLIKRLSKMQKEKLITDNDFSCFGEKIITENYIREIITDFQYSE